MKCDAVVLAAGKGKRMWPFTETTAKPAIPILDRPLMHYVLDVLQRNGVEKVCVVVGYHKDDVVSSVVDYGIKAKFIEQGEQRGTGHALLVAEKYVSDDFFVINGDSLLLDPPILKERSMLVVRRRHSGEYGTVVVRNGVVVDLIEKTPGDTVNAGFYRLSSQVFEYLASTPPSPRGEIEITDALPALRLRAVYTSSEKWMDVGRPWDVLEASKRVLLRKGHRVLGNVERGAVLKGPIFVSPDAEIRSGVYVQGPVYIGPGAVVGPNAYVRPYSVISAGARVGNAVEIKASVLMQGTHVSHLSYVGDSVLGRNVNLGAGTITANLRFDNAPVLGVRRKLGAFVGDDVKTGVHVSLMPGVRIGPNSWIFPGTVVYRDVPSNSRYMG